jgi:hypothetical protein
MIKHEGTSSNHKYHDYPGFTIWNAIGILQAGKIITKQKITEIKSVVEGQIFMKAISLFAVKQGKNSNSPIDRKALFDAEMASLERTLKETKNWADQPTEELCHEMWQKHFTTEWEIFRLSGMYFMGFELPPFEEL